MEKLSGYSLDPIGGYWQYNGVYIPDSVNSVPCGDQANSIDRYGITTFMYSSRPNLSLKEYREKYAVLKDGKWFYVVPDSSLRKAIANRQQRTI